MKGSSLNLSAVTSMIGRLLIVAACIMLIPLAVSLIYGESDWPGFALASGAALLCGSAAVYFTRYCKRDVRLREGFLVVTLVWIIFGLFGMIPFMMCAHPLSFTDAYFEIISGLTTTGVSAFSNVSELSHGILFWRAFSQWVGGLGIILFVLALLPEFNKAAGISLYNAEATGIRHVKLHPRIRQTALSLWGVYVVITIVSALLLWAGPMSFFDSLCHSFTAVATGGFSTRNEGPVSWHSDYVMIVLTAEMFVAGINFMVLYGAFRSDMRSLWRNTVVRTYTMMTLCFFGALVVYALVRGNWTGTGDLVIDRLFHVVSAATSTGFAIPGSEYWGPFAFMLTFLLMLIGSCAGSTTGGLKVDRIVILLKNIRNEISTSVYRKRVRVVRLDGSSLDSSQLGRITAFVTLYFVLLAAAVCIVTFVGYDFTDSLFMVSSCIGCNGLGYGITGQTGSYASLCDCVKWLLTLLMLVGRLELFAFVVLLVPSSWRR